MNGGWLGRESYLLFSVSVSLNPLVAGSSNFSWSLILFQELCRIREIHEFCVLWLLLRRWEKKCIVYCLLCIFVIISGSSTIRRRRSRRRRRRRISFVVLLNCLYLNPQVFPFVHSSPHPTEGEEEGWESGCLVLSCQLPS